ncbi:MAG: hypothetical protein M1839_004825 [Geoglossum umbratile]|nr:MAG: hypothetical protein M1839_004825 [Geoglossum umbratile]
MGTELYQARRLLTGGPRSTVGEGHVHMFRPNEEHRRLKWPPTSPTTPRVPVSPVELDSLAGDKWREFELPTKELVLVEVGTPPEICRIIRESLENQVAARQEFLCGPGPSFREIEIDHSPLFMDSTDRGARPAAATATGPDDSQHLQHVLQDSSSSSVSASSGMRSNGSSVRIAGLTPSTSRSSNSSRAPSRIPSPSVQESEVKDEVPLPFGSLFGPLPTNNRVTGPRQLSPRAAQLKKFWNDRMSEGECASCMDSVKNRKLVALQCQHKYCAECFSKLIVTALMDESYFPPKCCTIEVPVKTIQGHLSFMQRVLYKRKSKEYAVPAGERLFCPYPTCARWNPPSKKVVKFGAIKCRYCIRKICFTCKGAAHDAGADCPQDFALEATMRQAHRSGWRRCPRCKNMVEKQSGCIHITCKCKAEWCYTCGAQWKVCSCTEEDEILRREALEQQADGEDGEAREIAAAIANIERQEREEMEGAVARAEQEAREAARREEERLRAERLQAESKRRQTNQVRERAMRIEAERLKSTADELRGLWTALHGVHMMQRRVLLQRHAEDRSKFVSDAEGAEIAYHKTCSLEETTIKAQHSEAMQNRRVAHTTTSQAFQSRQQTEDSCYISLRAYLGGDAGWERDDWAIITKARAKHNKQLGEFIARQGAEISCANVPYEQWLRRIQSSEAATREAKKRREREALELQELRQVADLLWFEALASERTRMLEDLEAQMVSPPSALTI